MISTGKKFGRLGALLIAVLITATIVGVARDALLDRASAAIVPPDQRAVSLYGSMALFFVGGLPASVVTWIMSRRRDDVSDLIATMKYAAVGNLVSLALGLTFLPFLIWDVAARLATTFSLAGLGFVSFFLAVTLPGVLRGNGFPRSVERD